MNPLHRALATIAGAVDADAALAFEAKIVMARCPTVAPGFVDVEPFGVWLATRTGEPLSWVLTMLQEEIATLTEATG